MAAKIRNFTKQNGQVMASKIPRALLRTYRPQQAWLAHGSELHGVDHLMRVFILQELICDKLEAAGQKIDRQVTRWASIVHDVGRVDDGLDLDHGWRSAAWVKEHLANDMSPEMMDAVTYCIHWHVPPDSEAPVMTPELQVLKDADSLDRVRFDGLDPSYLRTAAARELIQTATQLELLSREVLSYEAFSYEALTYEAVVAAAEQLGLIA